MTESVVYCVDTSALIDFRILYRRGTFPSLWASLTGLVAAQRLIAPREVWREIKKDDELPLWVRQSNNRRMFKRLRAEGMRTVHTILSKYPKLVDWGKETPDADPFVIALAMSMNAQQQDLFSPRTCVVVTSEKAHPQGRPHIPDVCKDLGVGCICGEAALGDLFEREGWQF